MGKKKEKEHEKEEEKNGLGFSDSIAELTCEMEKALDEKRFRHTLSVAQMAASLAMRYGEDPYKAYTAGLLHDCAKCLSSKEKLALAKKNGLEVRPFEEETPDLLHAPLGSILAEKKYGIKDPEILSAIRYHTTGKPEMSTLEKIIYIADYIEIFRKPLARLEEARTEAFRDLDECMVVILESVLSYLGKKLATLDPLTEETYRYYKTKEKTNE